MYVASAFGLVVGICAKKLLEDVTFINSKDFQPLVAWIIAFDSNCNQDVEEPNEVQYMVESSQGQVSVVSRENLTQGSQTREAIRDFIKQHLTMSVAFFANKIVK